MAGTVPRIPPVDDPSEEVRELLANTMLRDGRPLGVFATMAWHPRLMKRVNVLGGYLLQKGTIGAREREIVILRTAFRAQAVYEFGQHTLVGREAGLSDAEIRAIASEDPADFEPPDRALIRMVDDLETSATIADSTWSALAERWSDAELLELIMLAGFYRMIATYLNAADVQREQGVPGWPAPSTEPTAPGS